MKLRASFSRLLVLFPGDAEPPVFLCAAVVVCGREAPTEASNCVSLEYGSDGVKGPQYCARGAGVQVLAKRALCKGELYIGFLQGMCLASMTCKVMRKSGEINFLCIVRRWGGEPQGVNLRALQPVEGY
ncbi:hypothetical protein NDU88_001653 [Pleurodeles waltl]|uniref:Uncharacterized protein n=1 Tax=Pleurodeles waltl TaxID=8319 RepID=A0AAV7P4M1_PLEWA|nr:hypothetical protein NDU88_001653 [Pleurodeles waltl]